MASRSLTSSSSPSVWTRAFGSTPVAATLVAADLDLAPDVGLDLATEVTLDLDVRAVDRVAKLDQLLVTQLVDAQVGADPGGLQQLLGASTADAVDVGECDLDALVAREVNTNEACHVWRFPFGSSQRCLVVSHPGLVLRAPAFCSGGGSLVLRPAKRSR
jgi:hypothetical protein